MTEVKELRLPYTDLTVLSIACKRCGGEVVLNVADVAPESNVTCSPNISQ